MQKQMEDEKVIETNWAGTFMTTKMFKDIMKRLQAFGLLMLVMENKITDNCSIGLNIYQDEFKNAFENHEIYVDQKY